MRAAADLGPTGPAVMFRRIRGYGDQKLVASVHGLWANHALMLGMPKTATLKDQFHELDRRWHKDEGELRWVDRAPCQEVVLDGGFNLLELLPLFRVNQNDGGFYLSKASVVSNDPDDPESLDKENVGIYRIQVLDADTLAMQGLPFHDIAMHICKAEERNEPLPVAVCLGVSPMLSFVSSTPLEYTQSEYSTALRSTEHRWI